ncbi:MAG TPA: hypothetical protein PLE30_09480 [Candidatus Kapabacteria bacterium]|nr:hypothetical protein [Candidatus Kapabacteria bacterium]
MAFKFIDNDISTISNILNQQAKSFADSWSWHINDPDGQKPLIISLYNIIDSPTNLVNSLISVQSRHGYYELHNIKYFLAFEPDEVIFISESEEFISCLIIGKNSTCSLFSNIKKELLKMNFADLHPATLMAAMQISITESILEN